MQMAKFAATMLSHSDPVSFFALVLVAISGSTALWCCLTG